MRVKERESRRCVRGEVVSANYEVTVMRQRQCDQWPLCYSVPLSLLAGRIPPYHHHTHWGFSKVLHLWAN